MNIANRLKQLSLPKLFRLGWLFLRNPLEIYPTYTASKNTILTCDKLFGKMHHSNGKENAFRHAYWNYKICENSFKRTKNRQKSAKWAKKVTDLYEKVTRNDSLDVAMDLHNNEIGRALFLTKNNVNLIDLLKNMMKNAQKIAKIEEIDANSKNLVFISE